MTGEDDEADAAGVHGGADAMPDVSEDDEHMQEAFAWLRQAAAEVEADKGEIDDNTESSQQDADNHDDTGAAADGTDVAADHSHASISAGPRHSSSFGPSPVLKSPRMAVAAKCAMPDKIIGSDDANCIAAVLSSECTTAPNSDSDDDIVCLTKQQYQHRRHIEPGGGRSHPAFATATMAAGSPAFTTTAPSFRSAQAELDVREQRRRERQAMRQRKVEQRIKVERLAAGAATAARHSQFKVKGESVAAVGCDTGHEHTDSTIACELTKQGPGDRRGAAQNMQRGNAPVPAYLLKRQLSAAKQRAAPGHSSLDDERHCTHRWQRSAAALRAARNSECGYDFLDRIEERAADHYSFVQRAEGFGRECVARAERARQEQEYAALLDVDKRRCPRCGMVQSLDELRQRKKHCSRCGPGVLYARLPRGHGCGNRAHDLPPRGNLQRGRASQASQQQRTADDGRSQHAADDCSPSLVEQVFRNEHSPAAERKRALEATAAAAGGGAFLQRQKVDEMKRGIVGTERNVAASSADARTRTHVMRRFDALLAMRRTGETPAQPAEPASFVERCRMEQLRAGLLVEPSSAEEEEAFRRYAEMRDKQEVKRSIVRAARHKATQMALARRRETYQAQRAQRRAHRYGQHVERRRRLQQRKIQDPNCTFRPDCGASRQMMSISFSTFASTVDSLGDGRRSPSAFSGSVRGEYDFYPSNSW